MSSFGLEVDELKGFNLIDWSFYSYIKEEHHCHVRVTSKTHGSFEIRIRNFN